MSLEQTIEDLRKQRDEALEREEGENTVVEEQEEEPVVKEDLSEENKTEEVAAEEKPKEEKLDDSGYARLRREAAAEKKRADAATARAEAAEAKAVEFTAGKEATEKEVQEVDPEIALVVRDHRIGRAEKEFQQFENNFRSKQPDYDAVAGEYAAALAASIRIQNPRKSNMEVAELAKHELLKKAGGFLNAGFDPIEELYHEAKELGFTGKSMQRQQEKEEKPEPKPDMSKVASNRKRSAGTAASTGESKTDLTRQYIAENGITGAEWMKLSAEKKKELMFG